MDPRDTALFLLGAAEAARVRRVRLGWTDAIDQYERTLRNVILPGLRAP